MADVGLGQLVTSTGRARRKARTDAVTDNHPLFALMKDNGGIRRIDGGRTVVEEAISGQNTSGGWVGEAGQVSIADVKVLDAAEYEWKYQLYPIVWTLAERYKNSGGEDTKLIDIVTAKYEAAEATAMNEFHEGALSSGTGSGGLQLNGLASLVSTTPTTGTVGGISRSNSNAAWFRNQKFDTAADWSEGSVDAGNVKRFLDKGINVTTRNGKSMIDGFLMGQTHFEYLTQAINAIQQIVNVNETGKAGFEKLVYRGKPAYLGSGISYSGFSQMTATRTYGLCVKPGGVNLVYHRKAEFEMLEEIQANDQAAISRLMFTMATMTIGGLAKFNWVGFD